MRQLELVMTDALKLDVGGNAIAHVAAVGKLDLAEVQLVKEGVPLTLDDTLATVQARVANYTGYANGVVTWAAGAKNSETGKIEFVGTTTLFVPSDGVTPNTIRSIALLNTGTTKFYGFANMTGTPVPMRDALDTMRVTIVYCPQDDSFSVVLV